ncbi:hypothetical protein V6N11_058546 [Hibiscus sabdariffa]|uniref:DUF4283 domain-containing protein n=1 Tax=Hibiscus sabdariffa TaxID=183260 RepID=A0ABR2U4J4_9ROSI
MRLENLLGIQVMRISGDRVFLIFYDVDTRSRMLNSGVLSKWFSRVVDWNEDDCAIGCKRVWISGFGLPIHAWSRETFECLVMHWGTVIRVEEETLESSSFEWG